VAVSATETSGGKHLGDTKVRYSWTLSLNGMMHHVEFTNSKTSGKKRIFVDGRPIFEQKVYRGGKFEHSWPLGNFLLSIVPKSGGGFIESTAYELRINGNAFDKFREDGGGRDNPSSPDRDEESSFRKPWSMLKGGEQRAATTAPMRALWSRMGGEERRGLQSGQSGGEDESGDEQMGASRSWGGGGRGLLAGSDGEGDPGGTNGFLRSRLESDDAGRSPAPSSAVPLADSQVVLPTAAARSKSEGKKKRKSGRTDPFAAFAFPVQGDPFGAMPAALPAPTQDPWAAFPAFPASSSAPEKAAPAAVAGSPLAASPSPDGSSQGGFPAWPSATDSFSSLSAVGSPAAATYASFHGSSSASASASPLAGEVLISPSGAIAGRKPLPTQPLPWEPQAPAAAGPRSEGTSARLPSGALQIQSELDSSPGSSPSNNVRPVRERRGLLDDSDQDSDESSAAALSDGHADVTPTRTRLGLLAPSASAPSGAFATAPASTTWPEWGASAAAKAVPPPTQQSPPESPWPVHQKAATWGGEQQAAKAASPSPWAASPTPAAASSAGAWASAPGPPTQAKAAPGKPASSPWDAWPGPAAKAVAPPEASAAKARAAAAPLPVANPWGVCVSTGDTSSAAGAAPKAQAPADSQRLSDPWGALTAAPAVPKQAPAAAAPCPWG